MFARAGSRFLQSIIAEDSENVEEMIGFLGGIPGSGKSRVIKAFQGLAKAWNCDDALETVAYQGVAAKAANGQTTHKRFQWGINSNCYTKRYSLEQKEQFAPLKMLIVDEASTADVKLIGMIDHVLRQLKNKPNAVFGGVHVLFVGDWLQQLPVAGTPAFVTHPPLPSRNRPGDKHCNDTATYLARIQGIEAYHQINEVVILDENIRHRSDPVWVSILNRWRYGDYREEAIEYVNQICYKENWESVAADTPTFCPIIVTSNTLRNEFNEEAAEIFCGINSKTLHQFPPIVTRERFQLSPNQHRSLRLLRDDKTGNIPIVLNLAIGMPVQCTQNVSRALQLANGTIGHVVGFQAARNDIVRTVTKKKSNGNLCVCIHSKPPDIVFLKLLDHDGPSLVQGLPPGIVPVQAREKPRISVNLPHRFFTVQVTQAPLAPAFSLTSEKCQGLTVGKAAISPLRHPTRNSPQRSSFYVAVTRVTTLKQLFLTEKLTMENLTFFVPNKDALEETKRLEELEKSVTNVESSQQNMSFAVLIHVAQNELPLITNFRAHPGACPRS